LRRIYDARLSAPPAPDFDTCFPGGDRPNAARQDIRRQTSAIYRDVSRLHEIMRAQARISATDGKHSWMSLPKV